WAWNLPNTLQLGWPPARSGTDQKPTPRTTLQRLPPVQKPGLTLPAPHRTQSSAAPFLSLSGLARTCSAQREPTSRVHPSWLSAMATPVLRSEEHTSELQ